MGNNISYTYQEKPLGIAHAIRLTEEFAGDDNFIVFLGDNYLNDGISGLYSIYSSEDMDGMFALVKVKNHSQFGIAEVRKRKIVNLVEKPTEPKSDLAIAEVYFLKPEIEIDVMGMECTGRRFENFRSLEHEICAWTGRRQNEDLAGQRRIRSYQNIMYSN